MYIIHWYNKQTPNNENTRIVLELEDLYDTVKILNKNEENVTRAFEINAKEMAHMDVEFHAEFLDGCDQCDDRDA